MDITILRKSGATVHVYKNLYLHLAHYGGGVPSWHNITRDVVLGLSLQYYGFSGDYVQMANICDFQLGKTLGDYAQIFSSMSPNIGLYVDKSNPMIKKYIKRYAKQFSKALGTSIPKKSNYPQFLNYLEPCHGNNLCGFKYLNHDLRVIVHNDRAAIYANMRLCNAVMKYYDKHHKVIKRSFPHYTQANDVYIYGIFDKDRFLYFGSISNKQKTSTTEKLYIMRRMAELGNFPDDIFSDDADDVDDDYDDDDDVPGAGDLLDGDDDIDINDPNLFNNDSGDNDFLRGGGRSNIIASRII